MTTAAYPASSRQPTTRGPGSQITCQRIVHKKPWLDRILLGINLLHSLASAGFFQVPGNAGLLFLAKAARSGATAISFLRMATERPAGRARPEGTAPGQRRLGTITSPPSRLPRRSQARGQPYSGEGSASPYLGCMKGTARSPSPQRRGSAAATDPLQTRAAPPAQRAVPGSQSGRSRQRCGVVCCGGAG